MLQAIDLNHSLSRKAYKKELLRAQLQLRQLAYQLYLSKRSMVVLFEGLEGTGKSSSIKRVTQQLDPRGYEVYTIGSPSDEERAHHYLWRFWRCLIPPDKKQILIFNRSWYGRVLTERVQGVHPRSVWRRAYREINEFERHLVDFGIIIAKFWLHISPEEQLRRFEARTKAADRIWKSTQEIAGQRAQSELYEEAVEDMLLRTSTVPAPWTIIESNDKRYARVKTVQTLVGLLTRELNYQPADLLKSFQVSTEDTTNLTG
jgi:polyphosphate kinase 2 (PPK2 family)